MNHPKAHGGYARQAKRRDEEFLACNTCGGRAHVRHAPDIEPIIGGWREVREILAGLVIFGGLFIGMPFLLWLVDGATR